MSRLICFCSALGVMVTDPLRIMGERDMLKQAEWLNRLSLSPFGVILGVSAFTSSSSGLVSALGVTRISLPSFFSASSV